MTTTHVTYRISDGVVIKTHKSDPSVPDGMKVGLAALASETAQIGWIVKNGAAGDQAYWANQSILADIDKLQADLLKPRTHVELLLGDTKYALEQYAKIVALREKLQ